MITLLPYEDFFMSAACLSTDDLVEQWHDCLALMPQVLAEEDIGELAAQMWAEWPNSFIEYCIAIGSEMRSRGYDAYDNPASKINPEWGMKRPPWLGNERLHGSHRGYLLSQNHDYYKGHHWLEKPLAMLWWPPEALMT